MLKLAAEYGNILKGLLSLVPGINHVLPKKNKPIGGTDSAIYCYGVWLKHLTMLYESGMHSVPNTLVELGPGSSLGVGIAAILSGTNKYYALDVAKYSDKRRNLEIFDELVNLFKVRMPRPTSGWPSFDCLLDGNLFPSHILTDDLLNKSLSENRLSLIRNAIKDTGYDNVIDNNISINYITPSFDDKSFDDKIILKETVDVVMSHSVLEYIVDIDKLNQVSYSWLKMNGFISHQIDISSLGFARTWNGHWTYPEFLWKIIAGRRPIINRKSCSEYVNSIINCNYKLVLNLKKHENTAVNRSELSKKWRNISNEDLTCYGIFLQAQKLG